MDRRSFQPLLGSIRRSGANSRRASFSLRGVEPLEDRRLLTADPLQASSALAHEYLAAAEMTVLAPEIEYCPPPQLPAPMSAATLSDAQAPLADTFRLHSLAGATKRIFLDFDGHTTSGTLWNSSFTGGAAINTGAYSQDSDPAFSNTELAAIQQIFQRVSEDFIGFQVDVTTEDPGAAALTNSGGSDAEWGVRVVIGGSSTDWYGASAGGVAYVGSFTWSSDTPTFVFEEMLGNGYDKYTAEAISHEVGHTLGLSHDGRTTPAEGYYAGHGSGETGWAPIMGVGYYQNLTQWSKGEYANANNLEDDLAIITTRNGFGYRANDYPTATPLTFSGNTATINGILETGDVSTDSFTFTTTGGTATIDLVPFSVGLGNSGADNDLSFLILNQAPGSVATAFAPQNTLDAHATLDLAAGTYQVLVYCQDNGDPLTTGYSDYASMGRYTLTVSLAGAEIDVRGNNLSIADGDTSPASTDATDFGSQSVASGTVSRTFTIVNSGTAPLILSGSPVVQISGANSSDFVVTAQPSSTIAAGSSTTFTITFDPSASGLRTATVNIANSDANESPYDFTIQGTGTTSPPEIDLRGNNVSIVDGDSSPATVDGTDFGFQNVSGGATTRTFTIVNSGAGPLSLTGSPVVQISGTHASDFTVTSQPSSTVASGGSTAFTIAFDPSATGLRTAKVTIANNDSNESPYDFTIQGTGGGPNSVYYLSTTGGGTLASTNGAPSVSFADADILKLTVQSNGQYQYDLHFDGSDVGLTTNDEDIDAFAMLSDGSIIVSTVGSFSVPAAGGGTLSGNREDLLRFVPSSLGPTTTGSWSMYFDGSDVGLTTSDENIDGIAVLSDGRLLVSTSGAFSVSGVSGQDEDLIAFAPRTLGSNTTGSWSMYFDGSDVGLASNNDEDVNAIFVRDTGGNPTLYLSTIGNFSVTGASGANEDAVAFVPTSLGNSTAGTFGPGLGFDGSLYGLSSYDVDGLHLAGQLSGAPALTAELPRTSPSASMAASSGDRSSLASALTLLSAGSSAVPQTSSAGLVVRNDTIAPQPHTESTVAQNAQAESAAKREQGLVAAKPSAGYFIDDELLDLLVAGRLR